MHIFWKHLEGRIVWVCLPSSVKNAWKCTWFYFSKTCWLFLSLHMVYLETSLVAQTVKDLPAMQETWVQYWVRDISGAWKCNPVQYSCLENSMDEEPGGLQSMGLQRVRHDWVTNTHTHTPHTWSVVENIIYVYLKEICVVGYSFDS